MVDADPFFVDPDPALRSGTECRLAEQRWRSAVHDAAERAWQEVHRLACGVGAPLVSNRSFAFFRRRDTGDLVIDYRVALGTPLPSIPVVRGAPLDPATLERSAAHARGFLTRHGLDPRCMLLTVMPSAYDAERLGEGIAAAIGAPWVNPAMEGLTTVDRAHLDATSAERWSAAFWQQAAPVGARCLSAR